ncbi:MAG: leucine-rich repeat domain-containing protein, partial [Candidatus Izemoplasmatales bacterium]|nr:leucine-rich repeat domain-containing protein [Candidatus Izemoplasmatales bacterium]
MNQYTITFDESIGSITGYTGSALDLIIPSVINGVEVKIIGDKAFYSKNLNSVTIPNSVTMIGESAFVGNYLTSITIPTGVTSIGNFAFSWNFITSVTIPNSVTTIGDYAFDWDKIESFSISNNQNFIYENNLLLSADKKTILAGIGSLYSVTIPDTVTTIG